MPRIKRGVSSHRRHKKILQITKGFRGKRKNVFKLAKNAAMKAGTNAYIGRKLKKRTFHQLWVLRINAACREHGLKYSRFIYGLELADIGINRKMLAELAVNNPDVFKIIVEKAKSVLPPEGQAPDLEELRKRYSAREEKKAPAKVETSVAAGEPKPRKTAPKAAKKTIEKKAE